MAFFIAFFFILMIIYSVIIERYKEGWNSISVKDYTSHQPQTFVSIIIPARNEAAQLPALIQSLLEQDYPARQHEIIIADDGSDDNSLEILETYATVSNLKVLRIPPSGLSTGHKKHAIETAIKAASGPLIITTDADCTFPPRWIHTLTSAYELSGAKMLAAPVKLHIQSNFLYYFQLVDFLTLQGITGAAVSRRYHIMCNGANLAYEKKAFQDVNGFDDIKNTASGDDMLLMQKMWEKYPDKIHYVKNHDAIVSTIPPNTWKAFFNQRIRWAGKTSYYKDKKILQIMLLVYAVNLSFFVLFILSFWMNQGFFFFILFFIAKVVIEFPFVQTVARFFGQTHVMKYFVILQPVHILYTIVAGFLAKFGSFEWKGRVLTR